ncbi:MFS-type transporter dbaD [Paramyrothecium foliicola]|nr:MFS-type transporter dbaD [Paramyrothecium foliicola]
MRETMEYTSANGSPDLERRQGPPRAAGHSTPGHHDVEPKDDEHETAEDTTSSSHKSERDYEHDGAETRAAVDSGASAPGHGIMSQVVSRISSRSSIDPGPPPDGGWQAWTQSFCGHLVIMNTWGWVNSFGVFQAYYVDTLGRSPSEVSWIGSVAVFLLFFVGTFTGRLTDAGYFRPVFAAGTALLVAGAFATSACTQYWQLMLAQGLCMGVGCGCLFCPMMAVLSTYFSRRRGLAMGVAACGAVVGGVVYPLVVRQMLPRAGFAWAVRTVGFIMAGTLGLANVLAKPRIKPRRAGPLVEWAAFKELEYTFYAAAAFFNFWGVYFAFFYVAAYSREIVHPPFTYTESLNLLLIMNGVSLTGRLAPAWLADRIGAVNAFIPCSAASSVLVLCWIGVRSAGGMYGWAVVYGAAAGGIQSLFNAALSSLTTDPRKAGVRMGMVFTIVSFAVLTGPPIAGAAIRAAGGSYVGAQVFAGTVLAVGCGFLVAAKVLHPGPPSPAAAAAAAAAALNWGTLSFSTSPVCVRPTIHEADNLWILVPDSLKLDISRSSETPPCLLSRPGPAQLSSAQLSQPTQVMAHLIATAALGLAAVSAASPQPPLPQYDWSSIRPSSDIVWHNCYGDEFQCARLVLPMDWLSADPDLLQVTARPLDLDETNEANNRTLAIAIIKLPAVVPDSDPSFAGPLFTNPGGPGNSGVAFLLRMGRHLQYTADRPGRRHYDILSFDPRGIGESEPRADCFHHNLLARQAMELEDRGTWGLDTGRSSLTYSLAAMDAFGRRCEESDRRFGADVMRYVGTPSVARDMVEMADKIDLERRQRLATRKADPQEQANHPITPSELKKRMVVEPKEPVRIQYLGFSYGTVLGNYFAALFPHRVGRLILDGVCDTDDYATGPGWLTNLADTDELFYHFLQGCHKAGSSVCALANSSDESWTDLRERVLAFVDNLDSRPQAALMTNGNNVVVTGHDIRRLIGIMLYMPLLLYRPFASMLEGVLQGNFTLLAETLVEGGYIPVLSEGCSASSAPEKGDGDGDEPVPQPAVQGIEGLYAILCGDGDDITDREVDWWSEYVARQVSTSRIFGAYWSTIRFGCSGWRFRPNWSYKGPFTTPPAGSGPGAPSAPVLFLTNRLDPVTPLRNARTMAAHHPGAGVVVQESMGHCALASAPSRCTADLVAEYLEHGTVPDGEVTCAEDCGPWDDECELEGVDVSTNSPSQRTWSDGGRDMFSIFRRRNLHSVRLPKNPLGVW